MNYVNITTIYNQYKVVKLEIIYKRQLKVLGLFRLGLGEKRNHKAGSAITNRREPRSCLVQVFNSKLGHIATLGSKYMVCMQPPLKLKTRPKARPVS